MSDWVVCAFHTPDYFPWVPSLKASLDSVGAPHDIVETAKLSGGWEVNTLAKPTQVLAAMDRHPNKIIIFMDVDATVHGDLAPLAATTADVGLYFRGRRKRNGGYRMHARSGTLVLRPTAGARQFVEKWIEMTRDCGYGDVDQTSLTLAMGECPQTSFLPLDEVWCGTNGDLQAIILHDRASARLAKVSRLSRSFSSARSVLSRNTLMDSLLRNTLLASTGAVLSMAAGLWVIGHWTAKPLALSMLGPLLLYPLLVLALTYIMARLDKVR